MRRCLVTLAVMLICVACDLPGHASPSPLAQASASPSELASPTPTPSVPELKVTAAAFHAGEIGFGYAPASPTATGGAPPYTWAVSSGALPTGLVMDTSGAVSGTPSALGSFLFTVTVSDTGGNSASIDTAINVVKRLTVSPTCPLNFPCMVEAGCVTACAVFGNEDGGLPPYSYRIVGGGLPTGMGLNGFTLVKAFPAPPAGGTKDWVLTVRVTDGLGATAQTTAKFHVFSHITFTQPIPACTGTTIGTGCTATLHYTGGTPGLVSPPVKTTPSPMPTGWKVAAASGTLNVTIPPSCTKPGLQFTATLTLVLVDGSICASGGVYCSSAPAVVKITLPC